MKNVLTLAAVLEAATGFGLLLAPALVGQLLLGAELSGVAAVIARVSGITLIALSFACLPGRTPFGGMLVYNTLMTPYLAYLAVAGEFTGKLLWPAAILHVVIVCLLVLAARTRKNSSLESGT
jgi:hypothetical protein